MTPCSAAVVSPLTNFNGNFFTGLDMGPKLDLTKCTLSENFPELILPNCLFLFGHIVVLQERSLDGL